MIMKKLTVLLIFLFIFQTAFADTAIYEMDMADTAIGGMPAGWSRDYGGVAPSADYSIGVADNSGVKSLRLHKNSILTAGVAIMRYDFQESVSGIVRVNLKYKNTAKSAQENFALRSAGTDGITITNIWNGDADYYNVVETGKTVPVIKFAATVFDVTVTANLSNVTFDGINPGYFKVTFTNVSNGETGGVISPVKNNAVSFDSIAVTNNLSYNNGRTMDLDIWDLSVTKLAVFEPAFKNEVTVEGNTVKSRLSNLSRTDREATVAACVYRNNHLIYSSISNAVNVPHYTPDDGVIPYAYVDLPLNVAREELFDDIKYSVYTVDNMNALNLLDSWGELDYDNTSPDEKISGVNPLTNETVITATAPFVTAVYQNNALYEFKAVKGGGTYKMPVKFYGAGGLYKISLNEGGTLYSRDINFTNELSNNLLSAVVNSTTVAGIKTNLDNFMDSIGFSHPLYNKNKAEIKDGETFYSFLLGEKPANAVELEDFLKTASVMFEIKKSKSAAVVAEYAGDLGLSYIDAVNLLNKTNVVTNSVRNYWYGKVAETAIVSRSDFLRNISESLILAVCEKSIGSLAGEAVIEELNLANDDYNKLPAGKKATVAENIVNTKYTSVYNIRVKFLDGVSNAGTTTAGTKTGGGGGGNRQTVTIPQIIPASLPDLPAPDYKLPPKQDNVEFDDADIPDWAKSSINELSSRGIVQGGGDNKFMPNDNVKRAEFIKMIVQTLGIETTYVGSGFDDIAHDAWYYPYISAGYNKGIILGTGDNNFGAELYITREDTAVIIRRSMDKCGIYYEEKETGTFADDAVINGYAKSAVYTLRGLGIISGTPDNMFNPKSSATRAECAKMLAFLISYIER
jgi:hypothetical protein